MIRRFLPVLLVFLVLANQGLSLAHAHRGIGDAGPDSRTTRPHFHVGGHVHHDGIHTHHHPGHSRSDHSDRTQHSGDHGTMLPSFCSPLGEHDSDAVYCGESVTIVRDGEPVRISSTSDFATVPIVEVASHCDWLLRAGSLHGPPTSEFGTACPLYLRTLSLRL